MSREIKFRAWFDDGKAQDMFFVGDAYGTNHPLDCCRYAQDGQPVTLMQYTGLKDKNGVEIYESDVLQTEIDFGYGFQQVIAKVIWKDSGWQFDSEAGCAYGSTGTFEVIGNIYQNPELLNATKSK